jgi:hypothetical protein
MAITITEQHKLFFKWTVLVWLNAAVSFIIAMEGHNRLADILGIICGVFTFVGIYTVIDAHLIKIQAIKLRKSLFYTVLLKALTQFYPVIEMGTGIVSTGFIENIGLNNIPFISAYLITLSDGILLSIVVALFMLIAKCTVFIIRRFKQQNT